MYDVLLSGCFGGKPRYEMPINKIPKLNVTGEDLILVLDPSSSQTGIALGDTKGNLFLFQDFKNLVCDRATFIAYLDGYLQLLCRQYKVKMMVYEVPFDQSGGDMASVVLTEIERNLRRYSEKIPSLTKEGMFPILPSVWRKHFLASKEYNGQRRERSLLKEATRKECTKRYPEYYDYFYKTKNPPDSTDAIGIYHGFLSEYWWDASTGIKRVSKVNSRYSKNHGYDYEVIAMPLKDATMFAAMRYGMASLEIFAYTKELNLVDTVEIVTAQTDNPCVVLALDPVSKSLLQWSVTQGSVDTPDAICAIVCRRTHGKDV